MHPVTIKDMPKFPFLASPPGPTGNIFMLKNNSSLKQYSLLKPESCMTPLLFHSFWKKVQKIASICKMLLVSYHSLQEMLKLCCNTEPLRWRCTEVETHFFWHWSLHCRCDFKVLTVLGLKSFLVWLWYSGIGLWALAFIRIDEFLSQRHNCCSFSDK